MKLKLLISASLVLFVALLLFQSSLGAPNIETLRNFAFPNRVYLPLIFRSGSTLTPTMTFTATNSPTGTLSDTPTFTISPTSTWTYTPSNTPTFTFTPTKTLTFTPSNTPTFTFTPTETLTSTKTQTATSSPTLSGKQPLSRFGVALGRTLLPWTDYSSNDITSLRIGWYVDYHVSANAPNPYGIEYMPTIHVKQLKLAADGVTKVTCRPGDYYVSPAEYTVTPSIAEIQSIASNRPGLTWLVGNEIERRDWSSGSACGGQDEITPELYAQAYHDIYTAIKAADPTAKVANGSLVEFTTLRQKYLNRVWAEYTRLFGQDMPVDVWNMHFFALREVKGSYGAEIPAGLSDTAGVQYSDPPGENWKFTNLWTQVLLLRTWMKDHGQRNKPLISTEYGVNYPYSYFSCFDDPDPTACPLQLKNNVMNPSLDAFLNQTDATIGDPEDGNHLIQRWAWWSLDYDVGTCDNGVYVDDFGGALINSGMGPLNPPYTCSWPTKGLSILGTYWKQYVQALP